MPFARRGANLPGMNSAKTPCDLGFEVRDAIATDLTVVRIP
jgi:hypothetical protein